MRTWLVRLLDGSVIRVDALEERNLVKEFEEHPKTEGTWPNKKTNYWKPNEETAIHPDTIASIKIRQVRRVRRLGFIDSQD